MKKFLLVGLFLIIGTVRQGIAIEMDPIKEFKSKVDAKDKPLWESKLSDNDILAWWKIGDSLVLSLYNNVIHDQNPSDVFKDLDKYKAEEITLFTPKHGGIGLSYKAHRPPGNAAQNFDIMIVPLNDDKTINFVHFERLWYDGPNCKGFLISPGTFRIIEKNNSTKKYEITGRQEETNFFRQIAASVKFKYYNGNNVLPYDWNPSLSGDKIQEINKTISFNAHYSIGLMGDPYISTMIVSWEYGPGKKLHATQYIYEPFSMNDQNLNLSDEIREGKPVKLAP